MVEQHSGFGFKCSQCKQVFNRPDNHRQKCASATFALVNRKTGKSSPDDAAEFDSFKKSLSSLINRVPRLVSITPDARMQRCKENRSKSHKGTAQHLSPNQTPPKFLKSSALMIRENSTTLTDRQPLAYLPLTEPVSPFSMKSHSSICKHSVKKPADQHHQTLQLVTIPAPATTSPKPLDLTTSVKTCFSPKPAIPPASSSSSSSSSSTLSSVSSPAVSLHADPNDVLTTTQEDQYEVEEISCPTYNPTPVQEIRLKGLMLSQKQRIYLNVGGTKFETSVPTLQADPSSLLSHMVMPSSPMKPYSVDNIYSYFVDRDPKLFSFILSYLRNGADLPMSQLPKDLQLLKSIQMEAEFFNLRHLEVLLVFVILLN